MRILVARNFSHHPERPGTIEVGMGYVLGLRALGHEVVVIEEVDPGRLFDADWQPVPFERWPNRLGFEAIMRDYGVWPRAALVHEQGAATHGIPFDELAAFAAGADLLLDLGARPRTPELFEAAGRRAYVDGAPVKVQVNTEEYGLDYYGFDRYEHHFTVALNVGRPGNPIPTTGLDWKPIIQPVPLDLWPAAINEGCERFTTQTNWAGRHTFEVDGQNVGEKSDQWLRFIELPRHTSQPLELTLTVRPGYEADVPRFAANGWSVRDPAEVATAADYRHYIAGSRAEFSVAHNRYVRFDSGWFSDRSARYLAAGKPVLVQRTGVEDHLPVGEGILTFASLEEAAAGIDSINGDYLSHCRAARAIAEERFEATRVMSGMLEQMGLEARAPAAEAV